jgi:archaellum component FlaG (FlaF/FlaG flagellin family)
MAWSTSTSKLLLFILSVVICTARHGGQSSAFTANTRQLQQQRSMISKSSAGSSRSATTATTMTSDTPETLPEFPTVEEYLAYMKTVSDLPKGFATGTSDGTFISVEAPSLGSLKIRATVIQLTDGPTDSWAACFTSNKVR